MCVSVEELRELTSRCHAQFFFFSVLFIFLAVYTWVGDGVLGF